MNSIPNKIPTVTLNINGQEVKGHPLSAIIDTSWADDSNLEKLTLTINSFKFDVYASTKDIRQLIHYLNQEVAKCTK